MTVPLAAEAIGDVASASAASGESTAALGSRSVTQRTGVAPSRPRTPTRTSSPATAPPASTRTGTGSQTGRGRGSGRRSSGGFTGPKLTSKGSGAHRLVIAEFLLCVVLIGLSPILVRQPGGDGHLYIANDFIRLSAVCLLFFVLALLANQPNTARWAAAFGGLVTLGTLFNASQAVTALGSIFTASTAHGTVATGTPGGAQATGVSGL